MVKYVKMGCVYWYEVIKNGMYLVVSRSVMI